MNFDSGPGTACDEGEARRIIDAYLDAGGNVIDTADIYCGGRSEEIVGRAITARRDSVVLATKGSGPLGEGPNDRGLSRMHLTRALEASLRRLRTDHVDLYQCHNWSGDTPVEETMSTLDGFVRSGKVRYIGCSNYTAAQIVECQLTSRHLGATPFVSLQPHYSLLARDIEAEILPTCDRHGLGTLTYGALASGMLAGRYRRGAEPEEGSRMHRWLNLPHPAAVRWVGAMMTDRNFEVVDEVVQAAGKLGSTPAAVAIAWVAGRRGVSSVIVGPRSVDQLADNLRGFALELPAEVAAHLETVSVPANQPINGMPVAQRGAV
jgi:aryl-alcohol dehydrogenase-like predicted oxidoreductase